MTMLSLSRRLGITPRPDHEYDPAAAGWLDSVRPESVDQEAGQPPLVPQQWAGTSAVRDRERAHHPADDQLSVGPDATARGPHPLGYADRAAVPPQAFGPPPDPRLGQTQPIKRPSAAAPPTRPDGAWPEICDQFGSHLLVLAEQLRASLNLLEEDEDDPERLKRLYQVDHAVTRMRLASRQLRTLAGRSEERLAGFTTSLLDVIRMATSAIEWYPQVTVGPVAELAVLGYAADDVATLMSALLDNATRYSPGPVTVSCHLLDEGGVMLRIEDTGIGIGREQGHEAERRLRRPGARGRRVDRRGTPASRSCTGSRASTRSACDSPPAARPAPARSRWSSLPPQLLCAIPVEATPPPGALAEQPAPQTGPQTGPPAGPAEAGTALAVLPEPALPAVAWPAAEAQEPVIQLAMAPEPGQDPRPCELPRREPASRRADQPRPAEAATASPLQQAAARRAFADELSAFSRGIHDALAARGITGGVVRATTRQCPDRGRRAVMSNPTDLPPQ